METFFANHPFGLAAVWTFADYEPTNLTGGFVNQASALAALDALSPDGCAGFTPLLEAICAAIDALAGAVPNPSPDQLFLAISSDGGENTSDGPCFGPPSFSGDSCDTFDVGSWHRILCDRSEGTIVTFVRHWDTFAVNRSPPIDKETGGAEAIGISDLLFFTSLASATNGRLTRHTDDQDDAAGACCRSGERCEESVRPATCAGMGGHYFGDGSACPESTCQTVPALSTWGVLILGLLLLCASTLAAQFRDSCQRVTEHRA